MNSGDAHVLLDQSEVSTKRQPQNNNINRPSDVVHCTAKRCVLVFADRQAPYQIRNMQTKKLVNYLLLFLLGAYREELAVPWTTTGERGAMDLSPPGT